MYAKTDDIGSITLTISGAVAATGLSRSTLYGLLKTGELPAIKLAGRTLIERAALVAWIDRAKKPFSRANDA